jgi:alpha-galactosidase
MSLWALMPSPLMLGMNLPDNDTWTTALLSNPEIVAVNQDPLGRSAHRVMGSRVEIWRKDLADGSFATGFFNRSDGLLKVDEIWSNLGFRARPKVRDLWLRSNLKPQTSFVTELPPHGCILLQIK